MHIVHLAAELAPIAKVGGLADVLHGLSRELVKQGDRVEIILPLHGCIPKSILAPSGEEFVCSFDGKRIANQVWRAEVDGLSLFFIAPKDETRYFPRERVYGYPDDVERYTYFSLAALHFLESTERVPDILHLHEWQTAIAAPLYRDKFDGTASLALTLHNLAYQGQCSPSDLDRVGLLGREYLTPDRMQDDEAPALINLLKGGIVYADAVNTVSPTYAQEILDGVHSHGLEATLIHHREKFRGILNGIDTEMWNPASDLHLLAPYGVGNLAPKKRNKQWLQERCGLEVSDRPLVATISRLAAQKGIPLIRHAILRTIELGGQFVLLGSPATSDIEAEFLSLRDEPQKGQSIYIELGQNEELAHQIYAGADMLLAPSLFEPCGLVQMVAMQYGTVPIVRKTGGLADTVFDADDQTLPEEMRNGYLFRKPSSSGVDSALDRALATYAKDPEGFCKIAQRGMMLDHSWREPAAHYIEMYRGIADLAWQG